METLIRVRPDEVKMDLLEKISRLVRDDKDAEILIHVRQAVPSNLAEESTADYFIQLNKSIKEMKEGKTVSFSMDEFQAYVENNFSL
jgi:hypothetical protein